MARTSRKRTSAKPAPFILRLLPEGAQAFVARRFVDMIALIFTGLGLFTLLAVASYDRADPSWNTAAPIEEGTSLANWVGAGGAWISDFLLQTLGLGAVVLGAGSLIWGIRLFRRHILSPFAARLAALMVTALLGAQACALWPSQDWLAHPYMGGAGGTLILEAIHGLVGAIPFIGMRGVLVGLSAVLALPAFLYAAAFTKVELLYALRVVWGLTRTIALVLYTNIAQFVAWVRHYNDPSYVAPARDPLFANFWAGLKKPENAKPQPAIAEPAPKAAAPKAPPPVPVPAPAPSKKADIPIMAPAQTGGVGGQSRFNLSSENWELPPLKLLQEPPAEATKSQLDKEALRGNAELLQNVLGDFSVEGEIVSIHPGPVVTLYELEPAPGTKTARVISLSDDIARSMSAVSVRSAVVPGRNVIGIELPNAQRQIVYMRDLLSTDLFQNTKAALPLILGKDIGGQPIIADLAKMPHLLVAGTTGSGKSVAVNTMLMSLLYALPPEKCRFILIDPKMLELSVYDDIPHLLSPVVTEPGKAVVALKWAVQEMEERYRAMSKLGVRNIEGYNARLREAAKTGEVIMRKVQTGFDPDTGKPVYEEEPLDLTELPYIVIVVDEFADLMLVAGKDVENAIQRLAQMARAAGLHIIMATQRPSVDVITGVIKANFPTRISFQVTSKIDSRTILGEGGAEQLLGMGDMLYMASGGRIQRVHGPFASDKEVEDVVNFLKSQGQPAYLDEVTEGGDFGDSEIMNAMFGGGDAEGSNSVDELYDQAVAIVARERKASTSFIQRHLQIGYNRAARIVEEMERQGVISPANATGKREVLVGDVNG